MNNKLHFKEIKSRYKFNFIVMTLIFCAALISASAEYYGLFATMMSRELLFSTVIIFGIFLFIVWLPSYLVPRMTSAIFLMVMIIAIVISIFMSSTTLYQFIFEQLMLGVVYLICLLRYNRVKKKLNKLVPDEFMLMGYSNYKLYELNIINLVLNCVCIFAAVISKLSLVTVIFSCIAVIIVIFNCYRRMFNVHLDCTNKVLFLAEVVGILAAYITTFYLMWLSSPYTYYIVVLILLLPHWLTTFRVWKEFSQIIK